MKHLIYILIILGLLTRFLPEEVYLYPIYAQEASKSATSSSPLQQKLDELKKQIASRSAQLKNTLNNKLQNKFLMGVVQSKEEQSLVLQTSEKPITVLTNEYTVVLKKPAPKKAPLFKDIKEADFLVALGDIDDKGSLLAKRIVLASKPQIATVSAYLGEVTEVQKTTLSLKTKDKVINLKLAKPVYLTGNQEESSSVNLKPGKSIVAVVENETIKTIYYLEAKAASSPSASPSATIKPTPKASPKATPKATPRPSGGL